MQSGKETNEENQYVLYKFTAVWCGPCKSQLLKVTCQNCVHAVKTQYPTFEFKEIDVDDAENAELISTYKINAMPTFVLVNCTTSSEMGRVVGANTVALENMVLSLLKNDSL